MSFIPETDIRPSMMAKGIPTLGGGLRSAEYEPAEENRTATIALFPSAFTNKEIPTIALAHELSHHWEISNSFADYISHPLSVYPAEAKPVIKSVFNTQQREGHWRSGHSPRFVSKAIEVSNTLSIELPKMLVHR